MTTLLGQDLLDSALVGLAVPASVKLRTIATAAKRQNNSYFKVDREIIKASLQKDAKITVLSAAIVATVFFVGKQWSRLQAIDAEPVSFVERVTAERSDRPLGR